ncbi:amidohydrolase family protein [Sphingobium boeckii]|uniref:Putative TIM-barrel fold metal-dependent hydrolase n=1 Tax=Sphingobium boeckii TaxID=1082345 RepID=A0A7W9EEM1_9SPHN|nr:amidohydrolase family protein [Sphingobium boeckii]MBB5684816.1 putative TIM-barrel fold metal-dependent hydrolase [Sphingobium boeckii]
MNHIANLDLSPPLRQTSPLIDLHAHVILPGFYDQDPFWGPRWEQGDDGELRLRIGHWLLTLGIPEQKAALSRGEKFGIEGIMNAWGNPAGRLKAMDALNQSAQAVSIPSHAYMYWADRDFSIRFAQTCNDTLAEYCSRGNDRLYFWAHAPLNAPEEAAKEIRRAVKLGAVGLSAGGSNFGGLDFDSPELDPVWQAMCDVDLPIFVHGYNQSVTWGERANEDRYETTSIVGMNYDETKCFWYLTVGGVLDRFPDLKVYITHAGGFVPYQIGRFEETVKNLDVSRNQKPLRHYLKRNFWFDPELHELPMRQALVEVIGADNLLYGTNFGGSDAIRTDLTEGLRISDSDRRKIRYENAVDLCRFDLPKIMAKQATV